jgi:hypothetical protein
VCDNVGVECGGTPSTPDPTHTYIYIYIPRGDQCLLINFTLHTLTPTANKPAINYQNAFRNLHIRHCHSGYYLGRTRRCRRVSSIAFRYRSLLKPSDEDSLVPYSTPPSRVFNLRSLVSDSVFSTPPSPVSSPPLMSPKGEP